METIKEKGFLSEDIAEYVKKYRKNKRQFGEDFDIIVELKGLAA